MNDQEKDYLISVLRNYYQSFTETALPGEFLINGILIDRIPIPKEQVKKRIREVLLEEIGAEIDLLSKH